MKISSLFKVSKHQAFDKWILLLSKSFQFLNLHFFLYFCLTYFTQIMSSSSTCVVENGKMSFFIMAELYSSVCVCVCYVMLYFYIFFDNLRNVCWFAMSGVPSMKFEIGPDTQRTSKDWKNRQTASDWQVVDLIRKGT